MRKVVVYTLVSLDGVAEAPETFFGWDDALDDHLSDVISGQDAVILGRRSYDEWSRFWPESDLEPFAAFINGVAKHVVTSTPLDPTWDGSAVVDGDPVTFVRRLKDAPGGDIGVHASITVAQTLLTAGLVDELRLVVCPQVVGQGRRLLDAVPAVQLELTNCVASPTGYLVLDYRIAR